MSSTDAKLDWYVKARYGLFIHYGLYSIPARGEWVLNREQIPLGEYRKLTSQFTADKFDADAIADLAVRSAMKYIIFTTMHHDGFRLYNTDLSDFSTVKTASGRDLTAELIAAARKRGLKIGLYHSLNTWTDTPDAVAALENKDAYDVFIKDTFARVKELVTRYNPIDVLWYDGWWPFNAEGWHSEEMNAMVTAIQPNILFNGRNGLVGDFATPENHISAPKPWRPWEACMTLNNNWGFHQADHEWKTPQQLVDMLAQVAAGKGNLLVNIGPRGDGSVPERSAEILLEVGEWLSRCGECVTDTDMFTWDLRERGDHRSDWCGYGPFTAKGNNLYLLLRRYVPHTMTLGGVESRIKSITLLGKETRTLTWQQIDKRVVITGLPASPPDPLCPVLKFECDGPPMLYNSGGMRTPNVPHPHYDPCPSDLAH